MHFEVVADERLTIRAGEPLASFYQLSPCVWRNGGRLEIMVRAVNHSDDASQKVARIFHGTSPDGLNFYMNAAPAIAPGPGPDDRDGCEDPTVTLRDGVLAVYYTGWNQSLRQATLMLARGEASGSLEKCGAVLRSSASHANPKEAEIVCAADGSWRLFFEFSADGASKVGVAHASSVDGPWRFEGVPFAARPGAWDGFHLSTGPAVPAGDGVVMFYNGATAQAAWRIGWVCFDPNYDKTIERCDAPLIVPPRPSGDDTDIAFAASAIVDGDVVRLYYSIADQYMRRATILVRAR